MHSGLRITYYIRSGIRFVILAASSSLINLRCVTLKKWSHILFFREGGGMGYTTSNCNTRSVVDAVVVVAAAVVVVVAVDLRGRVKLSKF